MAEGVVHQGIPSRSARPVHSDISHHGVLNTAKVPVEGGWWPRAYEISSNIGWWVTPSTATRLHSLLGGTTQVCRYGNAAFEGEQRSLPGGWA
jgi:hypothetical protein